MTYENFITRLMEFLQEDPQSPFSKGKVLFCGKGLDIRTQEMDAYVQNVLLDTNKVYFNSSSEILAGDFFICFLGDSPREDGGVGVWTYRFLADACWEKYRKNGWEYVKNDFTAYFQSMQKQFGDNASDELVESACDYEKVRSRLFFRPLNYQANSEKLEESLYLRNGDIAQCAYILISDTKTDLLSAKVQKLNLEMWGVSREQVLADTLENAVRMMPPALFLSTADVLADRFQDPRRITPEEYQNGILGIFAPTLTTTRRRNGAISIFYPGVAENLSRCLGGNFYVLFSSVDECRLYPATKDLAFLRQSVEALYSAVVALEDRLTTNPYMYDAAYGRLQMLG